MYHKSFQRLTVIYFNVLLSNLHFERIQNARNVPTMHYESVSDGCLKKRSAKGIWGQMSPWNN